eukprot:3938567-Rhodomonas_salina.2
MEMHDAHTTVAVHTEHNFPKEMNIQSLLDVLIVLHDEDKVSYVKQLGKNFLVCKKSVISAIAAAAPGYVPY